MPDIRSHSTVQDGRKDTTHLISSSSFADMCEKSVMELFPHTQHRPICVRVEHVIVAQTTTFRRGFNMRKTDWNGYSTELGNLIEDVDATPENYGRFIEFRRVTSRKHIPRGCREQYITGLSEEPQSLHEAYKNSIQAIHLATQPRVHTGQGKVREKNNFSRSGKSQGENKFLTVREK